MYGAVIERGRVISAKDGKAIVETLERRGIVSLELRAMDGESLAVGDHVYFFLFSDGHGCILGKEPEGGDGRAIFTRNEKEKLHGIEAGAQKNVQSDWNATEGDASILNKPDLSTFVTTEQAAEAAPVQSVNGETGKVLVAAYPGKEAIVNLTHPVGSLYISFESTDPATLFGGSWKQIEDVFLLAAGTHHQARSTGGAETHTLTVNEMPAHEHDGLYWGVNYKANAYPWGLNNDGMGNGFSSTYSGTRGGPDDGHAMYTGEAGGDQSFSIMPPYLAVYVWRRTA